jgi:DNA repair exonuclease SbcCD ATPase subunit
MKIKELHISNFRNLAVLNLELKDTVTILSGKNGLGKSNALNAASYGITGTILTDKWGFGENDIDSIIPKGAVRGINPEVSIITDVGTKFTKKYVSQYSKDGSKVKGHTTEWYINDVPCKNETEYNEQFYSVFNYKPSLKTREVNELRLFTDPLYALQKLDAKQLRQLLVELGCSVSDEELYKMGFGDLRPYGDKYLGKWDVMRKDLKDKNKVLTKEIESLQAKLETVATIEGYDESKLKDLTAQYEALVAKKAVIQHSGANPQIVEFEKKIEAIKASIQTKVEEHQNGVQDKIKMLEEQKALELEKATSKVRKDLEPLYIEREKLNNEIERMNASIQSYTSAYNNQSNLMTQYVLMARNLSSKKTDLAIKLDVVRNSQYENTIICPVCGSMFPASEEEQAKFEAHKQEEINSMVEEIQKAETDKDSYKQEYDKAKALRDEAWQTVEECKVNLSVASERLEEINRQCKILESQPIDTSAVEELDKRISILELPVDVTKEYQDLASIKNKVDSLKNADALKVQDEINNIEIQITEVNSKISEEYVKKSKVAEKLEYEANLKATQEKLNDSECLLARCNRLIQTMISLINKKATEKTGLNFVMLEENLTNDGIKEVCYATVDGVPFKDVNTATKIKYGIKFIEKLKEILGHNDFPILADRLEGIDSFETIKNLTKEQLICTRVTDGKEITVC